MKKVLGLDLGTTSIGWAYVLQGENNDEKSSIVKAGVRVNPLSSDELDQFSKGKAITTCSDRTLKRQARRNLQRYKLKRDNLIAIFKRENWISDNASLSEDGKNSTYQTIELRAKAATEGISLEELARVLLLINKKRGYKSGRKATGDDEGHLIDGMSTAKVLYQRGITPGQYGYELITNGHKSLPEFYRSDLQNELDRIWAVQKEFYADILSPEFKEKISLQGESNANRLFYSTYQIHTADNKGKDRKTVYYQWRRDALRGQIPIEQVAYVISKLRGEIESSGYLGAISDRSKELFFNNQTVGQYIYAKLSENPHFSTANVAFYRQDYLDEFEKIWTVQSKYHNELNDALKKEIRDTVIFYQRNLRSQKNLVSFCEFEKKEVKVLIDGKERTKYRGCKVAPRSSLLFQEFKIWLILNNISISDRGGNSRRNLTEEEKKLLSNELSIHPKMSPTEVLKILGLAPRKFEINYKEVEGNTTLSRFYEKFIEIVNESGHGEFDLKKMHFEEASWIVKEVFEGLDFSSEILNYDSSLPKEEYEQQPLFKLWHLLYSFEGDNSQTGDRKLVEKIAAICKMPEEYAKILASITFADDYASLSHKAIRKILPFLKEGNTYDMACAYAGYNHSHYETKEERNNRTLCEKLPLISKGNLRNPVVEKILNQMVNVVNTIDSEFGKPDEIHIELARELKQSAKEREKATKDIADNTRKAAQIEDILRKEFHLQYVSRNDILRYKLYEELKENGYKTLYSGKYIPRNELFSKNIDIEHIIPQALLFDDSYSNKTLEYRDINIEKGKQTARDFVEGKYGPDGLERYELLVNDLYAREIISKAKKTKLLMRQNEIPEDFVNRDLSDSQYISKAAKGMLEDYVRVVVPTSGAITAFLREQWQLVDIMQELNLSKYEKVGKVKMVEKKDGKIKPEIEGWTKRNDHRHHAMDAITIAFTKPAHIQLLNRLNASSEVDSPDYQFRIDNTMKVGDKRILMPPMPLDEFRSICLKELDNILVSIKAKNKVTTNNVNRTKKHGGANSTIEKTPRGQLHKETVYGKRLKYETFYQSINAKLDYEAISSVASQAERKALSDRLEQFGGDPKKAFTGANSPAKKPIVLPDGTPIADKVKCVRFKSVFSIRKEVSPDLPIDKIMDVKVKDILRRRIEEFGGDQTKAFSNLDENPIWLNKEKGIAIKRVTIEEKFNLDALRIKRDKNGKPILGDDGIAIANDYVNLRNNHHVAIYEDENGNYQEVVVSFFEALQRVNSGYPIVDKDYNSSLGWKFIMTLKINEIFVFPNLEEGFFPSEVDLMNPSNNSIISRNMYRVQKLSSGIYYFRHHLETVLGEDLSLKDTTWKRISSLNNLKGAVKVRINHIGQIVAVGEYD